MLKGAALNLNVRSVMALDFMEFDKSTNMQDRGSLAIELPAEPAPALGQHNDLLDRYGTESAR